MTSILMSKVYIGKDVENRLLNAAELGEISTVKKILRLKVSPNARDECGFSAIAKASRGGHTEVVKTLIEAGADVKVTCSGLVTSLHLAAKGNHAEVVKHLILAGAPLDAETSTGLKPLDLVQYDTEVWGILNDARKGEMPEIKEYSEVPEIPDYALPSEAKSKNGKKGKKEKKGKKGSGKKGSGKKGSGKKGKKGKKKKKK